MHKIKIIPTAALHTYVEQYESILKEYSKQDINLIRISITRYTIDRYIKDLILMKKIYKQINGAKIEMMLDIPYPIIKPRIFFNGQDDIRHLKKGDEIEIVNNMEKLTDKNYCIDCVELFNEYVNGEEKYLSINDGKIICVMKYIDSEKLIFTVIKEGVVGYGKAIYTKSKYHNDNWSVYKELLEKVRPEYLVISETDNLDCLKQTLEYVQINKIKILIRIETYKVLLMLKNIIHHVDGIVFVRSKLALEDEGFYLGMWQEEVNKLCKKMKKKIFLETDILEKSCKGETNSLEFIDIYNSVKMEVSGIISSGFIGMGNNLSYFSSTVNRLIDAVNDY